MRPFTVLVIAAAVVAVAASALAGEEGAGGYLAQPLDAEILFPADNASFRSGNITAVIEASGESVAFFSDAFDSGTLVNASRDPSGVVGNGTGPSVESYYRSPEFELPRASPAIEWLWSLEYLTAGGQGNLTDFFQIQVRFGDLTPGRNWSTWYNAEIDGDFSGALGLESAALRTRGALQYQFVFLRPDNLSSPHLSGMELWFIGHVERVEAKLQADAAWTLVALAEGRYNVSFSLPEGTSTIEVRATDALGATRLDTVTVFRDNTAPLVASAPATGASIAADETAEIRFDGPMDTGSALGVVLVQADFPVDMVWTADGTTLIFSAQESGKRGPVTITIGPGLKDAAGNEFGHTSTYTYEMGAPPAAQQSSGPLLVAVLGIVGLAAIAVFYMMGRAKKQREAHADTVRAEMEAEHARPPTRP